MKSIDLSSAEVFDLTTVYLLVVVSMLKREGFGAAVQEVAEGTGRLWVMPKNTTVPTSQIAFTFGADDVEFVIITRDEKRLDRKVKYAEGIDGFIEDAQKFLRAGLLAKPKRAA